MKYERRSQFSFQIVIRCLLILLWFFYLKLRQVDVQRAIKPQRRRNGRHDLADQSVQVGIRGPFNVQVSATYIVDGFVVYHERTVRMLKRGVCGQNGIVRLYHGCRHLRRRVDRELQLALFPIVHAQPFHEQWSKPRTGTTAKWVEHQETLQPSALVRQLPDPVQYNVHDLFTDRIVATGIVVGGVLFSGNQLFGVKQLSVRASTHFIYCNNIL